LSTQTNTLPGELEGIKIPRLMLLLQLLEYSFWEGVIRGNKTTPHKPLEPLNSVGFETNGCIKTQRKLFVDGNFMVYLFQSLEEIEEMDGKTHQGRKSPDIAALICERRFCTPCARSQATVARASLSLGETRRPCPGGGDAWGAKKKGSEISGNRRKEALK